MEVKTRKQALLAGENKYFTGNACKNGHISYRYVQSGACYDCIRSIKIGVESETVKTRKKRLLEASAAVQAKNLIKENLVLVKVRMFPSERENIALAAYCLAAMRFPSITPEDVDPRIAPVGREASGTALYSFYCHDQDIGVLRKTADATFASYPLDGNARERAIANAQRFAEPDTTPPMSFK